MFAIDLLKGKGLPPKADPASQAMRAAGVAVPLMALLLLAGAWRYDHAQLNAQTDEIRKNEALLSENRERLSAYRNTSTHISELSKQLSQVAGALCCRIQITDVLNELLDRLPGQIFFHEISLDRTVNKEKFQPKGSKEAMQRTVINRSLTLVLCDFNTPDGDRLVQDYVDGLKISSVTGPLFKEIKTAARQQGVVDGRDATYYYIECALQEQTQ